MLIYLSGYTDLNNNWRKEAADSFVEDNIYCFDATRNNNDSMKNRLNVMSNADVLLVNLKNIDRSPNTSDEIFFAYIKQIPVIAFESDDPFDCPLSPWKKEQIWQIEKNLKDAIDYINNYILY